MRFHCGRETRRTAFNPRVQPTPPRRAADASSVSQTGKIVTLDELAVSLDAFERVDISEFQRRARVLQSLWRRSMGFDIGQHQGPSGSRPMGSRLPMPWAQETLSNFLTETVRDVVRSEVLDSGKSQGKFFAKPRIFDDLLSSQSLCFNLFGELTQDLNLASKAIADLSGGRFTEVTGIEFELSPGRRDARYLNDRSAFDVFVRCRNAAGDSCFIGIEVKYHENLIGTASEHKSRYDEVAGLMDCFEDDRLPLMKSPLQQIWRDHLLAGITRIQDGYGDGLFITLYPQGNTHVSGALAIYAAQLKRDDSFAGWTLERFIEALRRSSRAAWIDSFADRYLRFELPHPAVGGTRGA